MANNPTTNDNERNRFRAAYHNHWGTLVADKQFSTDWQAGDLERAGLRADEIIAGKPPTEAEERQTLKALVLKYLHSDVYIRLDLLCDLLESEVRGDPSPTHSKEALKDIGKHRAESAERLKLTRRRLAEDSQEGLIHYYFGHYGPPTLSWYTAAVDSGFLARMPLSLTRIDPPPPGSSEKFLSGG